MAYDGCSEIPSSSFETFAIAMLPLNKSPVIISSSIPITKAREAPCLPCSPQAFLKVDLQNISVALQKLMVSLQKLIAALQKVSNKQNPQKLAFKMHSFSFSHLRKLQFDMCVLFTRWLNSQRKEIFDFSSSCKTV